MNQAESLRQGTSGLGETGMSAGDAENKQDRGGAVTWPEEITGSFLEEAAWRGVLKKE